MHNKLKQIVAVFLISVFMIISFNSSVSAQVYEPTAAAKAVDVLVARPLGIASQAIGLVLFVVSLPFSLPGQNTSAVFQTTIVEPAKFTWTRPLGHAK